MAKDRVWINNGSISKRVKKADVQKFLDKGFVRGRLHERTIKKSSNSVLTYERICDTILESIETAVVSKS